MSESAEGNQTLKNKRKPILTVAVLLVTISLSTVMYLKLTKKTTKTASGEFAEMTLPEGSTAFLNVESEVSYAPHWWRYDRTVNLEGEAFFIINKGDPVTIWTERGTITTKGATVNIYCRKNIFQVFCKTGSVKVNTLLSGDVTLNKGEYTSLEDEYLNIEHVDEQQLLAWRENQFFYEKVSLEKVLIDFDRHYGVYIAYDTLIARGMNYTGQFSRGLEVTDALDKVCYDLGISYFQEGTDTFRIQSTDELRY